MRTEQEVFSDLATLCQSTGYAHAIAFFCYRDNMISHGDELTPKNLMKLFSHSRLIRSEISTLIGLMVQSKINFDLPDVAQLQSYIDRTESLLLEMHKAMTIPWWGDSNSTEDKKADLFTSRASWREPIFYGGESAYSFQYRDFAPKKYALDEPWLRANKAFSIEEARDVLLAVSDVQKGKLFETLNSFKSMPRNSWTILPGFSFSPNEIAESANLNLAEVVAVLEAFSLSSGDRNSSFKSMHDFNATNASPLIRYGHNQFILFQTYSFVEALYDAPFYWMISDSAYSSKAMSHRGKFTEGFSFEKLSNVFGKEHVHSNVILVESKEKTVGEIDALVFFGNRAIVLQAKSKKLTINARKGNDSQIKSDFKSAIQDSYDQAVLCASFLDDRRIKLISPDGREIIRPENLKQIYPICLVADHYPALNFQSRQFLSLKSVDKVTSPLIADVFALDAIAEFLNTPLHFLNYIDLRAKYGEKLVITHEFAALSYHLSRNLWLEDDYNLMLLQDDISVELDVAMMVRREGFAGKHTPEGILTRLKDTVIRRISKEIESSPHPSTVDLGLVLLQLDEHTVVNLSKNIDRIAALARADGKRHDITVPFEFASSGLTIHCSNDPAAIAMPNLQRHCEARKYTQRAKSWFGLLIEPSRVAVRLGFQIDHPWEQNDEMDAFTKGLPEPKKMSLWAVGKNSAKKVARNDLCPCGSGKKHKKCCLK